MEIEYIVHRRFKSQAICGEINLPVFTKCKCEDYLITLEGNPICYNTSENAHQYFARNDDGNGILRGQLTQKIQRKLRNNQKRWDKVWPDTFCQKYRRKDFDDYWLWNHEFFNASIEDLEYIAKLVN